MKKLLVELLVLATVSIWVGVATLPDNKLHIIFCDVGQGDATLITYKTTQILVDTGPNARVIDCLSRHLPFYDHTLEAVVVTHNQNDHTGGSRYITERYSVVQFEPVLTKGKMLVAGALKLGIISPEEKVLGMNTLGMENDEGIVSEISWNKFKVLLTADASDKMYKDENGVTVLKIPHHGSKFAITKEWLAKTLPKVAVISVGKNSYGHPAPEILKMLEELGIKTLRTDKNGDVEIVTDGYTFFVKSSN